MMTGLAGLRFPPSETAPGPLDEGQQCASFMHSAGLAEQVDHGDDNHDDGKHELLELGDNCGEPEHAGRNGPPASNESRIFDVTDDARFDDDDCSTLEPLLPEEAAEFVDRAERLYSGMPRNFLQMFADAHSGEEL